jgi:hypothetical protein
MQNGIVQQENKKEKILFFSKTKDDLSSYFLHLFRGLFRLWDVGCLGDYTKPT